MVLINNLTIDEINAALVHLQRSRTEVVGGGTQTTIQNISINNSGSGSSQDWSSVITIIQERLKEHDVTLSDIDTRLKTEEGTNEYQQEQIESLLEQLSELADNGIDSLSFDEDTRMLTINTNGGSIYQTEITSEVLELTFDDTTNKLTLTMGEQTQEVTLPYINASEKGVAGGVATLDSSGRVPYSQLPESAMEFKGEWDASTNTPQLSDGTGTNGDFYICSVGGSVNFGTVAEPRVVVFYPNDRVIYESSSGEWIRLPAGSVVSVNGQSGAVELDADDIPYDSTQSVKDAIDSATQSDWTETDSSDPSFIKHKPPIWITQGSATDNMTPVDSVTSGEMRPVTSNAVAQSCYQKGKHITLQGKTYATNTFADDNPKIEFENEDATQGISLTFTDYDSVQSPASLTLNGNQGGEVFIAPILKAITNLVTPKINGYPAIVVTDVSFSVTESYVKFSNGLLIQWGRRTNSTSNGYSLRYPKAFTSATSYYINVSPNSYVDHVMNCYNRTAQTCTVNRASSASTDWTWFAIGY